MAAYTDMRDVYVAMYVRLTNREMSVYGTYMCMLLCMWCKLTEKCPYTYMHVYVAMTVRQTNRDMSTYVHACVCSDERETY